ncbi:hypothetical protein F8G81_23400 [Arthrobacter sp. CDRTa11]|nr:hypothetical protein F8G81_23400 [Arthrobacter sp. CDRTa11]
MATGVIDIAGVHVLFVVVRLRFEGTRLAEYFAAQGVREERFNVGRVGGNHQVQQVSGGCVVGDQVGGGLGNAEVQDLHRAGALTRGYFAGALGNLFSVLRAGNQNADRTVENLVHPVQHQIVVVRSQYCGCDLVAAAEH